MAYIVTHKFTRVSPHTLFFGSYAEGHPESPATVAQKAMKAARAQMGVGETSVLSADKLVATITQTYADKAQFDKFRADHADEIELLDTARDVYLDAVDITHETTYAGE